MLIRIVDVETTGLDPAIHRICEIATVDLIIGNHGKIERGRMWSSLVNPERDIPPEASAVHDITDQMVKDAQKIGDLLQTIVEGAPDFYCAHNSRFDSKFINPKDAVWLDTYRIALWLWPDAPSHSNACLRYFMKLKLNEDTASFPHRFGNGHVALWDAYVTAAILRRAFKEGATVEQMVEVSSQPAFLPRFTFGKHAMKPIAEVDSGYLDWILSQQGMDEDVKHTAFWELENRRKAAEAKQ